MCGPSARWTRAGQQQPPVHKKLMVPRASGKFAGPLTKACLQRAPVLLDYTRAASPARETGWATASTHLPLLSRNYLAQDLTSFAFSFLSNQTRKQQQKSLGSSLRGISTENMGEVPSNWGALLGTKRNCCCCCYYCHQGPLKVHRIQRVKQDGILLPLKRVCLVTTYTFSPTQRSSKLQLQPY